MQTQLITIDAEAFYQEMEVRFRKIAKEEFHQKTGNTTDDELLTVKDIQRLFGISKTTVYRYIKNQVLPSIKLRHTRYFKKSDVMQVMQDHYKQYKNL